MLSDSKASKKKQRLAQNEGWGYFSTCPNECMLVSGFDPMDSEGFHLMIGLSSGDVLGISPVGQLEGSQRGDTTLSARAQLAADILLVLEARAALGRVAGRRLAGCTLLHADALCGQLTGDQSATGLDRARLGLPWDLHARGIDSVLQVLNDKERREALVEGLVSRVPPDPSGGTPGGVRAEVKRFVPRCGPRSPCRAPRMRSLGQAQEIKGPPGPLYAPLLKGGEARLGLTHALGSIPCLTQPPLLPPSHTQTFADILPCFSASILACQPMPAGRPLRPPCPTSPSVTPPTGWPTGPRRGRRGSAAATIGVLSRHSCGCSCPTSNARGRT